MAWQSCSSICREDNVEFDYIRSPVTSGGGQPYNPCGFVTDIYIYIGVITLQLCIYSALAEFVYRVVVDCV